MVGTFSNFLRLMSQVIKLSIRMDDNQEREILFKRCITLSFLDFVQKILYEQSSNAEFVRRLIQLVRLIGRLFEGSSQTAIDLKPLE